MPDRLIFGTECSSNLSLSDHPTEQVLKLTMDFQIWGLHTAHLSFLLSSAGASASVYVLSREGQSVESNLGDLEFNFSPETGFFV